MTNNKYSSVGFKYREIHSDVDSVLQKQQLYTLTHNAIFFILEGGLEISWDNSDYVKFGTRELYFLPRGANVSACIVGENVKYIAAQLDNDLDNTYTFNSMLDIKLYPESYRFAPLPIKEPMMPFLDSVKYYIINGIDNPRLHNIKFLELNILFKSCYTREELANLFYPISKIVSKFNMFILDNYHVEISIDELAQKANMSRSTFDRTFKKNFGMTPHKWIDIQTSMLIHQKASEPNVTVKDIMYEVGVQNSSQFTQLCKRLFGVVPSKLIQE